MDEQLTDKTKKALSLCNDKEKTFILAYMDNFDIGKAATEAQYAGAPVRVGREVLRRLHVRNAIRNLREEAQGAIPFGEVEVSLLLWKEANNPKNTGTARVAAASKLADALRIIDSPDLPGAKKRIAAERREKDVDANRDLKQLAARKAIEKADGDIGDLTIILQQYSEPAKEALEHEG